MYKTTGRKKEYDCGDAGWEHRKTFTTNCLGGKCFI